MQALRAESADGAGGNGLRVDWAFHKTDSQIEAEGVAEYVAQVKELLTLAEDDGWTAEQLQAMIDDLIA